jgi:hypothetical protein
MPVISATLPLILSALLDSHRRQWRPTGKPHRGDAAGANQIDLALAEPVIML